jgi:catechol 2,3-dioxygenase-like lactoylglutathione lyase family enzyme
MKSKLLHIAIKCKNIDESIKFYQKVFGVSNVQRGEYEGIACANFEIPGTGTELELEAESMLKKIGLMTTENKFGIEHFCLKVDNIDEAWKELTSKGAIPFGGPFIKAPWELQKGVRQAFLLGPDEVIIELVEFHE